MLPGFLELGEGDLDRIVKARVLRDHDLGFVVIANQRQRVARHAVVFGGNHGHVVVDWADKLVLFAKLGDLAFGIIATIDSKLGRPDSPFELRGSERVNCLADDIDKVVN